MARCCNPVQNHLRPQVFWWGILAPCTDPTTDARTETLTAGRLGLKARSNRLRSLSRVYTGPIMNRYLDFLSIFNNQPHITPMWMYMNWDAREHT